MSHSAKSSLRRWSACLVSASSRWLLVLVLPGRRERAIRARRLRRSSYELRRWWRRTRRRSRSSGRTRTWSGPTSRVRRESGFPVLTGTLDGGAGRPGAVGSTPRSPTSPPSPPAPTGWSWAGSSPDRWSSRTTPTGRSSVAARRLRRERRRARERRRCTHPATSTTRGPGSATARTAVARSTCRGGWMDAGDQLKFTVTIGYAADAAPARRAQPARPGQALNAIADVGVRWLRQGPSDRPDLRGPGRRHRRRPQPRVPRPDQGRLVDEPAAVPPAVGGADPEAPAVPTSPRAPRPRWPWPRSAPRAHEEAADPCGRPRSGTPRRSRSARCRGTTAATRRTRSRTTSRARPSSCGGLTGNGRRTATTRWAG